MLYTNLVTYYILDTNKGGGMFEPDDQNNQQPNQDNGDNQQPAENPAAPPADHQFAPPQPAYESIFDDQANNNPAANSPQPAQDQSQVQANDQPNQPVDENSLLSLKQQALEQLSPLVSQLDQSPEEKFHTTMRIIQASDNHTLLKDAHEAALAIADDKVRAQALLDIINEINYFTKDESHGEHQEQPEHVHHDQPEGQA